MIMPIVMVLLVVINNCDDAINDNYNGNTDCYC